MILIVLILLLEFSIFRRRWLIRGAAFQIVIKSQLITGIAIELPIYTLIRCVIIIFLILLLLLYLWTVGVWCEFQIVVLVTVLGFACYSKRRYCATRARGIHFLKNVNTAFTFMMEMSLVLRWVVINNFRAAWPNQLGSWLLLISRFDIRWRFGNCGFNARRAPVCYHATCFTIVSFLNCSLQLRLFSFCIRSRLIEVSALSSYHSLATLLIIWC